MNSGTVNSFQRANFIYGRVTWRVFVLILALTTYSVYSRAQAVSLLATYQESINVINKQRAKLGIDAVALSVLSSKGCEKHANYLLLNKDVLEKAGGQHHEKKKYPGYTDEGNEVAENSEAFYGIGPAELSVTAFNTFYGRVILLNPALRRIGIGYAADSAGNSVTVLDYRSGASTNARKSVNFYPGDDEELVPLTISNLDGPFGINKGRGFPITITFTGDQKVENATFVLSDRGHTDIPCFVSDPQHPATGRDQMNTICAIPEQPLSSEVTYSVTVSCTINGKAFSKAYHFTTPPDMNLPGACISPLAGFSPRWNYSRYKRCNTAASAGYMNDTARLIIYMLNLARTNPRLYAETVLSRGNANFSDRAYVATFLKDLLGADTLGLLYPDSLCAATAQCQAVTFIGNCELGLYFAKCTPHTVYGRSAVDIVNSLLTDDAAWSASSRRICFSARYNKIGGYFSPGTGVLDLRKEHNYTPLQSVSAGAYTSPLSQFSKSWDNEYYKKCNTAEFANYMTKSEQMIIYILNMARSNPKLYAASVFDQGDTTSRTDYYTSLLKTLNETDTLPLLYPDSILFANAQCHAITSGKAGYCGHERLEARCKITNNFAECCDYGMNTPLETINRLLIDQDVPSLGHRANCLDRTVHKIGVSIQPHKLWQFTCVLDSD